MAGTVVSLVIAGCAVLAAAAGFLALREAGPLVAAQIAACLGALLGLVWVLVPVVVASEDQTLDPELLSPYPLRLRDIVLAQVASSLVGVLGPLSLLGMLTPVLSAHGPGQALLSLVAGVLGFVCFVVWARIAAACGRRLRRRRGLTTVLSALGYVLLMFSGLLFGLLSLILLRPSARQAATGIAGWIPWSAGYLAVADAAGTPTLLPVRLGLPVLGIGIGLWLLSALLRGELLTVSAGSSGRAQRGRTRRADDAAPGTGLALARGPVSAVAVRTGLDLLRDPRMSFSLLGVLGIAVLFTGLSALQDGAQALMAGPFAGLTACTIACYLTAYDNSAFSLHLLAPLTGRQDRWGRALGVLGVYLPATLVVSAACTVLAGFPEQVPANLGVSLGFCLIGTGVGAVASALWAAPVPPPGASPFKRAGGGAGSGAKMGMLLAALVCLALNLPAIILYLVSLVPGLGWLGWVALAVGIGLGLAVLGLGVRLGARRYDARAPELLAQVSVFR
ncbi:ABC-2 type transport system permease protein [Kocuria sp. AG109]|uniref:hypothetical protein n=1 Tax=Rothia kristinae TaxID=37923 RepID=UPI000ADBF1B5|nr:hypothetical protein [Rothia kristinae]MCA1169550.1 hypothetical protein [Rothia kristinae]MED6045851.1 hypothetical protein [Rothia kristinae]TDP56832.1 ABC-2 type transport system permease protein [Kocuria sp. AG109]WGH10147.1 hypothetical protein OU799_04385 [Rothia kristinae]